MGESGVWGWPWGEMGVDWDCGENVNASMEVDRSCECGVEVGEGVESVSGKGGVRGGGVEGSW